MTEQILNRAASKELGLGVHLTAGAFLGLVVGGFLGLVDPAVVAVRGGLSFNLRDLLQLTIESVAVIVPLVFGAGVLGGFTLWGSGRLSVTLRRTLLRSLPVLSSVGLFAYLVLRFTSADQPFLIHLLEQAAFSVVFGLPVFALLRYPIVRLAEGKYYMAIGVTLMMACLLILPAVVFFVTELGS